MAKAKAARYFCYRELLPFAAMVTVESTNVGLTTLLKAATVKGLSYRIFMLYSYAISALVLVPLVFLVHRKTPPPPLTAGYIGKFFILGFLGFTAQFIGYKGLDYSNPTLASAMSNLTPACTFVIAVLLRMEKIDIRRLSSQAKVIGTVVSIAGAMTVVLYKGPAVIRSESDSAFVALTAATSSSPSSNWTLGGALLAVAHITVAIWYTYQAKVVKEYPAEMVVVFFYSLFSCLISIPACLITDSDFSAWKVKADVRLISILYSGIVGSAFGIGVHTWGLHVKGPVYVTLFKPLSIVIAIFMGVIFLGDNLYLGSVIGSVILSMGFYAVIWGKVQEEEEDQKLEACGGSASPSSQKVPLLKGYSSMNPAERQDDETMFVA